MSNRVERLRIYLLGSATLLLLVIGAFIGAARYLRRHAVPAFPTQLAKDVLREAANFTYCQSDARSTKFCIHAAKSIEYSDGKLILRDATITLYGANQDRSDRIYGDEFEYDKTAQILRATGIVHIDLQAARSADASHTLQDSTAPAAVAKVMHVTTSGLVYLQKLGVAATSAPVDFEAGGLTGHAVGADYSSDSAMITLHSAVSMNGVAGGHPLSMTASTASFDDSSQQALLTRATYESEGRKATADEATLYRRTDGTLSRIAAKGNVTLQAKGGTVVSPQADVELGAQSEPQTAVLTGGVKLTLAEPLRTVNGGAEHAEIHFDSDRQPQPDRANFSGAVDMLERVRATTAAGEPWSTRELRAAQVDVALDHGPSGSPRLRDAVATGSARLISVSKGSLARAGHGTTELSAASLSGHFVDGRDPKATPQLDTISGRGSTQLQLVTPEGRQQTVSADSLDAKLRPQQLGKTAGAAEDIAQTLLSAVQQGHVQMTQRTPGKTTPDAQGRIQGEQIEHALGDRAVYDGDADRITLSGGVQLSDPDSMLWANSVALDHKTGDAHATGMVKVSYTAEPVHRNGGPPPEPTHLLADHADFVKATGISTFYGKPVRLWQEGNQILAPVVELSKIQNSVSARGDATMPVRTLIAGVDKSATTMKSVARGNAVAASPQQGCSVNAVAGSASANDSGTQASGAARITSAGLSYTSASRELKFTGGFRAETADGTIRAQQGTVYLIAATNGQSASGGPASTFSTADFSGQVDHIAASGRVELDKPGLKATGEHLDYKVDDRTAVLTGDAGAPPKAIGPQGTSTGYELRLRELCDGRGGVSVEVVSGPGQRAHTEVRMDEEPTGKEKAKR